MIYKFCDPSGFQKLENKENVTISSLALKELTNRDENIEVFEYREDMLIPFKEKNVRGIEHLAAAYAYDTYVHPDETVFVTCDVALSELANLYFGEDSIELL